MATIKNHGVLKDIEHTAKELKDGISNSPSNFIDLKLPSGNLWSKFNLGGTTPVDTGKYYFWGDLKGVIKEEMDSAAFNQDNEEIKTFLCPSEKLKVNGIIDNSYHLTDEYDPCLQVNDQAKIPNVQDWEELVNYCDFVWQESYEDPDTGEIYEGKGYKITRKNAQFIEDKSGFDPNNSIFLPITGFGNDNKLENPLSGLYWTSFAEPGTHNSFHLIFDDKPKDITVRQNYRFFGMPIRPIYRPSKAATMDKFGLVKISEDDWELEKPYQGKIGINPKGTIYAVNAHTKSDEDRKREARMNRLKPSLHRDEPNYAIPGTVVLCHDQKWYDNPAGGDYVNPSTDDFNIIKDLFPYKTKLEPEDLVGLSEDFEENRQALVEMGFVPSLYEKTVKHIAVPHWEVVWKLNGYMYGQDIKNSKYIQGDAEDDDYIPSGDDQPKLLKVGSIAKDMYGFVYADDPNTDPNKNIQILYDNTITYDNTDDKLYKKLGLKLQINGGTLEVKQYDPSYGGYLGTKTFSCRGLLPAIYGGRDYYYNGESNTTKNIPGLYTEIYGASDSYKDSLENNWKNLSEKYNSSSQKGIIKELYEVKKGLVDRMEKVLIELKEIKEAINTNNKNFPSLPCINAGAASYVKVELKTEEDE